MRHPDNSSQKHSPSFKLPVLDQDFLLGDSTRGVRFLLEYAKAEELLRAWKIRSTIVVFGSARTLVKDTRYEAARAFGYLASKRGGALKPDTDGWHDNVIATGGGPGIMEAANRGAFEAGAPSVGYNITLPHEQNPNSYTTPELTFQFHYFAMRKMHLAMRASALVVFPGGFGTLDELFELLTLRQTGKAALTVPIVLFDKAFWNKLINFRFLVDEKLIKERDLELFDFADTPQEIWDKLIAGGLRERGDYTLSKTEEEKPNPAK